CAPCRRASRSPSWCRTRGGRTCERCAPVSPCLNGRAGGSPLHVGVGAESRGGRTGHPSFGGDAGMYGRGAASPVLLASRPLTGGPRNGSAGITGNPVRIGSELVAVSG